MKHGLNARPRVGYEIRSAFALNQYNGKSFRFLISRSKPTTEWVRTFSKTDAILCRPCLTSPLSKKRSMVQNEPGRTCLLASSLAKQWRHPKYRSAVLLSGNVRRHRFVSFLQCRLRLNKESAVENLRLVRTFTYRRNTGQPLSFDFHNKEGAGLDLISRQRI